MLTARMKAAPCDGVLILGVATGAETFRVEGGACNHVKTDSRDADGACHAGAVISDAGPGRARSTGPTRTLVAAIARAGLPAAESEDAGDYLCNFVFYKALTRPDGPVTAFLHLPPVGAAGGVGLDDLERGVKAAASALAQSLAAGAPRRAGPETTKDAACTRA